MPFLGELSALLTACFWSGSAMVFASATTRVGWYQVNITRLILATGYLTFLTIILRLNTNLSGSQVLDLSLSGIVGLSLGDSFLFKAYQEIGARVTMLVMSLAPAIAALIAYIALDETLSAAGIAGIAITVIGVSAVVLDRGSGRVLVTTSGLLFALLAAVGQGGGLVLAKAAFRDGDLNGFVAAAVRIVASLAVLLPLGLLTKRFSNPMRMIHEDPRSFRLIALGSILGPFLGISFSLIAVQHTKVGVAAAIMAIVPILMLPLVRFVYKEHLTWKAIAGAFVAVAGVAVLFLR